MYTLNGLIVDNLELSVECLMTCDKSDQMYKAKCYSVNWFRNTRTCYLHTAKTNISDLKVATSSDFFLNKCAVSKILFWKEKALFSPTTLKLSDSYYCQDFYILHVLQKS
ncbi:unnamed protein product [Onchocerca flexuosa]|uniref:Apple domain-containing protein n=1 Tax=Onchocerca flexuosa TaxID=387005 RepID=A0A183HKI7_9BILA|nr:unnamed protein product [Onchocerca flexuosa]